ncbi:MAG TPA: MmgE/PrpD family protein [Limnochordales bacterium]
MAQPHTRDAVATPGAAEQPSIVRPPAGAGPQSDVHKPVISEQSATLPPSLARRLADWLVSLRHTPLPPRTAERMRAALLDAVGAGIYGTTTPWARAVIDWATELPLETGATVWGANGRRARPADAALANGTSIHSFELDDYHNAKLHPGAAVVPAALAVAEVVRPSGRELLKALAAGYEVMIRTSLALDPGAAKMRGWHLTGVCGPFGAAAAAAYLLGLDADQTTWALGLAGTQGAGLFAFNADGAMSKRLHPGRAAHAGVLAAQLAARGFTGPAYIYEADDGGFLRAHSDQARAERLLENLGTVFHADAINFKPYSCCGSVHSSIDAALRLRERLGGPPAPGQRVRVGMSQVLAVQCGFDYYPSTVLFAQMSLRYCVAAALVDGAALPPQFTPERIRDPQLVQLAAAMELIHDPELDRIYPTHFAGWVEVETSGGRLRVDVLDPTGSSANPMTLEQLKHKFRYVVGAVLPPERVQRLEEALLSVDQMADVSGLARELGVG